MPSDATYAILYIIITTSELPSQSEEGRVMEPLVHGEKILLIKFIN